MKNIIHQVMRQRNMTQTELAQRIGIRRDYLTLTKLGVSYESYYEMGKKMAHAYIDEGLLAGNKIMGEFDQFAEDNPVYILKSI